MRRLAFLSLVLTTLVPSSGAAFELRWEGEVPTPHSTVSQLCTLNRTGFSGELRT